MAILNLTPHSVEFYNQIQFENLEQRNATTWVADSVTGCPVAEFASVGELRIATATTEAEPTEGIPTVETVYGEVTGIPSTVSDDDVLIVSLPAMSMARAANHPLAQQMVCPYQVVRLRSNTSTVLGAMGLTK